ncbi:MAG: transcriptional repressor NrdR [Lachnospiraceae bacterium]|nr:transcriptional repressor NrdR [Lachnospiraceae bacterium]
MKCPYCSADDTRVIDSRPVEDNNSIRRRRICDKCSRRFTTYEKIESIPLVVIKKDNNREPYDRSKIEGGILRACHKRPVSIGQIRKIVDEVEAVVYDREDKEISSQEIGELVMNKIHDLDPVAYVRFASVYREFKDVETFMDELKKVLKTDRQTGRGQKESR